MAEYWSTERMCNEMISVIVPCYNLAGYTRKCVDSILKQTYKNIELIVIDDGSTDETPEILQEYADKDKRVVFVRQKNQGAGVAINYGISIAKGAYITFVDNDDWIEESMYEKLHTALIKNSADMAVCNYNLVYEDHTKYCYSKMKNESVNVYDDVYGYFMKYCACPQPNNYTWTRLYKAEIVRDSDVRFEYFPMGADTLFNFKLLPRVKRVAFVEEGLYNYVQRQNSSVYTAAKKHNIAQVYADGFEALANYYKEKEYTEFMCVLPFHAYTRLRSIYFYSRLSGLSDKEITDNVIKTFAGRKIADYLTGVIK